MSTHQSYLGTLWVQTSAEYKANSTQIYRFALNSIQPAMNDKYLSAAIEQNNFYKNLPPAVIFDIDETILDNSSYQAKLIFNHSTFNQKTWDHWVSLRQARAIPGAVEFINTIQQKGIQAIFITNRECRVRLNDASCPQELDTIENLKSIGVKYVNRNTVLLKHENIGWTSEKASRRAFISKHYRILMLVGDDLGDFIPNVKSKISYKQRNQLVEVYKAKWGIQWFMLSNPIYGSWERVLKSPESQYFKSY